MNKKSETALEYLFYGEEFELWKLNSAEDYFYFFSFLVIGIAILIIATQRMKKQRNDESGKARVAKRLSKMAKKPQLILRDVTLRLPEGDQKFDVLMVEKSGIYLGKVYGWGIKVFGTPDGEKWRLEDRVKKTEIPNPLHDLRKGVAGIEKVLEEKGIRHVKVMPVVVFADTFQTPELYLGYGSNSTTYQELKKWYQKQSNVKDITYDFERVSSLFKNELIK